MLQLNQAHCIAQYVQADKNQILKKLNAKTVVLGYSKLKIIYYVLNVAMEWFQMRDKVNAHHAYLDMKQTQTKIHVTYAIMAITILIMQDIV